ncbi:hypothetical protein [Mesorhizobium sp. M0771]|uniref:DUF7946 domain-containing protein n=1 Tax=Mesorhizobium sp. M0771 TaxID=2956997 RepID=UPI0033376024
MPEKLIFHFEGALADQHTLNFYEAARFQYAAARLIVKLLQFRSTGGFVKKITNTSNRDILLQSQDEGSFDISILMPALMVAQETFVSVSVTNLMSYIFERIVGKTSNSDVATALNAHTEVVAQIGHIDDNNTELINKALSIIQNDQEIKENLHGQQKELLERRIAELTREKEMTSASAQLGRIDGAREQKLISMSAPLVSEMATALRRSANTLQIVSVAGHSAPKGILFLNRRMAEEIEVSAVDQQITPILGDIIQYNKETGWGKARLTISAQPLSFNVPSDIKGRLQSQLLAAMGRDKVYLQTYIVRDKVGEPVRLIVVGILPPPPA